MTNLVQLRRPQGKPGPTLRPLADRKVRVALLAESYLDAAQTDRDGGRGGKPQSRCLGHDTELWPYGSYRALERVLDELRQADRHLSHHFWATHIQRQRSPHAPHRDAATHALGWVTNRMPDTIHVPYYVSIAAGYSPSDAKAFTLRWEQQEEAS